MVLKPLSDPALDLLNAALSGAGPNFGLLVVSNPTGGTVFARTGDDERRLHGSDAHAFMDAFRELLNQGMVAATASDGAPVEYIVTPLGCKTAWHQG